jgi:hypothetical protein
MTTFEWRPFLEQLSRAVLASPYVERFELPPEVIESGWLGYPPATDEQIAAAEARLGVTLPPSYKTFLKVTNGWRQTGGAVERLLPVEEIDWMRVLHSDWIDAWMTFGPGEYDPAFDPVDLRHMPETLVVSAVGDDAIMLLNPAAKKPDGEWQAWFFADWVPGADPYDSFLLMLQQKYETLLHISREEARRPLPGEPADTVITKLPELLDLLKEKADVHRGFAKRERLGGKGHDQGAVDGLKEVIAQVRAIQSQNLDPQTLRERLKTLAVEIESEAAQAQAEMQASIDVEDMLSPLFNPSDYSLLDMFKRIRNMSGALWVSGKLQGKREGAGIIRWFLRER